ncbi:hypothetical protein HOO65_011172 [Ceratocystis lukuohia]|uniref:Uncharacterized protein n=1 Tax=Ceratocystis lukuohia TaxID=2019550 RepID=A0ABR4MUD8_9PEZI
MPEAPKPPFQEQAAQSQPRTRLSRTGKFERSSRTGTQSSLLAFAAEATSLHRDRELFFLQKGVTVARPRASWFGALSGFRETYQLHSHHASSVKHLAGEGSMERDYRRRV